MFAWEDKNNNYVPDAWESLGENAKDTVTQLYKDARDAGGYIIKEGSAAARDITKGAGETLKGAGEGMEKAGSGLGDAANKGASSFSLLGVAGIIAAAAALYYVVKK